MISFDQMESSGLRIDSGGWREHLLVLLELRKLLT